MSEDVLVQQSKNADSGLMPQCCYICRLVFQNLLMESNASILSSSQDAWASLLASLAPDTLKTVASPQLTTTLFDLACTPSGCVLPSKHLLKFPMPASSDALLPAGSRPAAAKHIVGGEEGFDVAKMRLAAAQALGQLACKFAASGVAFVQTPVFDRAALLSNATAVKAYAAKIIDISSTLFCCAFMYSTCQDI